VKVALAVLVPSPTEDGPPKVAVGNAATVMEAVFVPTPPSLSVAVSVTV
jgi:hypothetical protein